MRRTLALLVAMILVLVACGDDDADTGETSAETTAPATEATAAETTTTIADTTTTAAPATTEAANASLEAAAALEGTYTGEWVNTTFGSTGPIELTIEVDEAAQFAILTLDLGGTVFGGSDPDPVVYEVDLVGSPSDFDNSDDLFGDSSATFDADGGFSLTAPSVPGVGGLEMTIEGQFTETGAEGTYTITGLADGTFTVASG